MNKNILNLNNRVRVQGIGAGGAIIVPAPIFIGTGSESGSKISERSRVGVGENR